MNKTILSIVLLVLLGLTFQAHSDQINPIAEIDQTVYLKATQCHESCDCEAKPKLGQTLEECSECNICTKCKHSGAKIVEQDYCVCLTPKFRQGRTEDNKWTCVEIEDPKPVPKCEWQLFNQIYNMEIVSNCYINTDGEGRNTVVDVINYDWQRITHQIDQECEKQLRTTLLWSPSCGDTDSYVALNAKYFKHDAETNFTTFEASLMDVYTLSTNLPDVQERSIFQIICLAVELSNLHVPIRLHKFQLRIFTNRDQVEVFHLDISKKITEGCDVGLQCIVVANLDTRGNICTNEACNDSDLLAAGSVPQYIVGEYLFVRIEFIDNTYTNYLSVQTLKFTDDRGVYSYDKYSQWWQIRQLKGRVDVKVYLWQPQVNAKVEVLLKITLQPDSPLRTLAADSTTGQLTKQSFAVQVAQPAAKNASQENNSNFSAKLFCGLILAAFALLF